MITYKKRIDQHNRVYNKVDLIVKYSISFFVFGLLSSLVFRSVGMALVAAFLPLPFMGYALCCQYEELFTKEPDREFFDSVYRGEWCQECDVPLHGKSLYLLQIHFGAVPRMDAPPKHSSENFHNDCFYCHELKHGLMAEMARMLERQKVVVNGTR